MFLQHAQQLDLQRRRQFPNLIQEDHTTIGYFEPALLQSYSTRERASFVAKQLAFEQALGNRGTINGDEGLARPWTIAVDGTRRQFFSRSAFTFDQHR